MAEFRWLLCKCRMELRCVIAVIRHGDRTPKQKMKMEVRHKMYDFVSDVVFVYHRNGQAYDIHAMFKLEAYH